MQLVENSAADDGVEARELTYDRIKQESDRLRDARQFFARQLGPLPAVGGISLGAVAAFSEKAKNCWLVVALVFFALMLVASFFYSRMPPYRELRSRALGVNGVDQGMPTTEPRDWYNAEINLETAIHGADRPPNLWKLLPPTRRGDMQDQLDKERFGLFLVQGLFLGVIASLIIAHLGSDKHGNQCSKSKQTSSAAARETVRTVPLGGDSDVLRLSVTRDGQAGPVRVVAESCKSN